ncbi:hypothetical protein [Pseudonocardia humida]|uniref:Small secreted domain DUF320 n=1 Tax=Pseudonocardia humida TaxID=2800819 RepID=A0ABT1A3Z0_9PSEU|nr:hypothetical protein [Pseudonocardia humida]MCO1657666.1 hypothetical protein [Pseudonocardia humida]
MLKKAGIVVAVAAAGLLSVSPLAFATDGGGDHHHGDRHHHRHHSAPQNIDYTNVERDNLTNDCSFAQDGPDVATTATGGSSLLGLGGLVANVVAPISAPIQALNCTNIGVSDVIDINSNNTTESRTSTEIEDSGNTSIDD